MSTWTEIPCVEYESPVLLYPQRNFKTERGWIPKRMHRILWEERYGAIPEGMQIHHLCENKRCLEVEHYELVAKGDHMRRFHRHTHCQRGHEMTPENVYIRPDTGHRICAVCASLRHKASYSYQLKRSVHNCRWCGAEFVGNVTANCCSNRCASQQRWAGLHCDC